MARQTADLRALPTVFAGRSSLPLLSRIGGRLGSMRRLLQRLLPFSLSGRSEPPVTCYMRENGPIAYGIDLFSSAPREAADAMLSSHFRWHWRSSARGWTELTRVSLSAFLADLQAAEVLIVGLDAEPPAGVSDSGVRDWIRPFSREEASPLAIAIRAAASRQLVFVQQQTTDAINGLLDAWKIDKSSANRKAYATLGPASLESLAALLDTTA